jgi:hypothetical protein
MSEFKGTKGPWVNNDGEISGWNGEYICDCIFFSSKVDSYNVLLISKAPEMLEMLERLSNHFGLFPDDRDSIKKLIKSATEL